MTCTVAIMSRRGWIVGCSVSCSATISRFVWLPCYLWAYGSNGRWENATIREKNLKPINSQTNCRHFDVKARRFREWFDYLGFRTANARQFSGISRCVTSEPCLFSLVESQRSLSVQHDGFFTCTASVFTKTTRLKVPKSVPTVASFSLQLRPLWL